MVKQTFDNGNYISCFFFFYFAYGGVYLYIKWRQTANSTALYTYKNIHTHTHRQTQTCGRVWCVNDTSKRDNLPCVLFEYFSIIYRAGTDVCGCAVCCSTTIATSLWEQTETHTHTHDMIYIYVYKINKKICTRARFAIRIVCCVNVVHLNRWTLHNRLWPRRAAHTTQTVEASFFLSKRYAILLQLRARGRREMYIRVFGGRMWVAVMFWGWWCGERWIFFAPILTLFSAHALL